MGKKHLSDKNSEGTVLGQSVTDKVSLYGKTPVVQPSGAAQAAVTATVTAVAPAGGTGAAAGGWDTAGHRDTAIATINESKALAEANKALLNKIRTDLVALGLLKGAA